MHFLLAKMKYFKNLGPKKAEKLQKIESTPVNKGIAPRFASLKFINKIDENA